MAYYGSTRINQGAAGLGTFFSGKVPAARAQSGLGQTYSEAVASLNHGQAIQLCNNLVEQNLVVYGRCDEALLAYIARIVDYMLTGYVDAGMARLQTLYAAGDITKLGYMTFVSLGTGSGTSGLGIVPQRTKDILAIVAPPLAMMGLGQDEIVEVIEEPLVSPVPEPLPEEAISVLPGEPGSYPVPPPPVIVEQPPSKYATLGKVLSYVGGVGGAYHGYKRNQSAGWAFGWFIFGSALPIFAIPVALAQGFAKPKRS
jgi:hypothetical protein